ncbi:MAG: hypothetical protein IPN71_06285 [Fibrobacteres bacterium]|nr:hypothetical protein [Fibrobacterota bacterium]
MAGPYHAAALDKNGKVFVWGCKVQQVIPADLKAKEIFAGGYQTWALRETPDPAGSLHRNRLSLESTNAFLPGDVQVRSVSGRVLWRGRLESLPEVSRIGTQEAILWWSTGGIGLQVPDHQAAVTRNT